MQQCASGNIWYVWLIQMYFRPGSEAVDVCTVDYSTKDNFVVLPSESCSLRYYAQIYCTHGLHVVQVYTMYMYMYVKDHFATWPDSKPWAYFVYTTY